MDKVENALNELLPTLNQKEKDHVTNIVLESVLCD